MEKLLQHGRSSAIIITKGVQDMEHITEASVNHFVRRQSFSGWEIQPRYIRDCELVLVLKGYGCIRAEGEIHEIKAGDLVCFQPGMEHSLWVDREPYMLFYGVHFDYQPHTRPLPFPLLLSFGAPNRLEPLFRQLQDAYLENGPLDKWHQSLLLQQILLEIFTHLQQKSEPMGHLRVRRALEYIHEDPCRPISLDDLYRQAGVQKTVFLRAFRQVTGTTPTQYIIRLRLETARELLTDTQLSVTQIAEQCGFQDPLYFSRCFRKHFALSPRQYRKSRPPLQY